MWDWAKPWGLGLHLVSLIPKRTILDWSSRLSFLPQFWIQKSHVYCYYYYYYYWSGRNLRKQSLLWKYFSFCEKQNLEQKEFNKRIDLKKKFPWVFILKRGFKANNSMVFVEIIKVLWKVSDVFEDLSVKTTISNKINLKENWIKERKYPWVLLLKKRVLIQKSHGFIILVENMA